MSSNPSRKKLYDVLVRLHGEVRQAQYPYSATAKKWGIIGEDELLALKSNPNATERDVWRGITGKDISLRIAGKLTNFIDERQPNLRREWKERGLAEGSWKVFLQTYCLLEVADQGINKPDYLRDAEFENLETFAKIIDDEIFKKIDAHSRHQYSLKTKWWKECHKRIVVSTIEAVHRGTPGGDRPKSPCHHLRWSPGTVAEIRGIVGRWRDCDIWNSSTIDFTSNNEKTIHGLLQANGFTEMYLEDRIR
ncbi:MAG: hypothetical protein VKP57_08030 [Candidatus Sericytochromatia bacterium]|nr:hypothetical protein [Candidatus Sericytochromatia bacterium]